MEVNILDEPVEPISQQIPLQGFEHRLEPITKAQFNVNKVFFAASKHQKESKKVNEVEYDEWDNEWKPKK